MVSVVTTAHEVNGHSHVLAEEEEGHVEYFFEVLAGWALEKLGKEMRTAVAGCSVQSCVVSAADRIFDLYVKIVHN